MAKVSAVWTGNGEFFSADGKVHLISNVPCEIDKKDFETLTKEGRNSELILAEKADKPVE